MNPKIIREMNKPTLKISQLKKQGIWNDSNENQLVNQKRQHKLKFYYDNPKLQQVNNLATFEVFSEQEACKLLAKFVLEGATIRAAFLTPNDNLLSKSISNRFYYKDHPTYNYFIGSD